MNTHLHLNELTRNDQRHPCPSLLPHRALHLIPRLTRPNTTPLQQSRDVIQVPNLITSPVRTSRAEDLELEGQDVAQDVGSRRGRLDGRECAEEVLAFRRGLVEEP